MDLQNGFDFFGCMLDWTLQNGFEFYLKNEQQFSNFMKYNKIVFKIVFCLGFGLKNDFVFPENDKIYIMVFSFL